MLNPGRLGVLFSQGDAANAVFYIQKGRIKLTAVSGQCKEAVIGILEQGTFSGKAVLPDSWCVSQRRPHRTRPWSRASTKPS
jgi:CRP-like cAMP-binding protein